MPNHKIITGHLPCLTADQLLDYLYEPGSAWWVKDAATWAQINALMAPTMEDFARHPSDIERLEGLSAAYAKYDIKAITPTHASEPVGYLFALRGDKLNVSIRSPETLAQWGLDELPPLLIGQALRGYEKAFGTWISGAPSTTGLRMMGDLGTLGCGGVDRPVDLSPFENNDAQDFIWTRELTAEEKAMPFLHAFDKRMAYLYSSDIDLGVGNWLHVVERPEAYAGRPAYDYWDKRTPGLWRIEFIPDFADGSVLVDSRLPWPAQNFKRGHWYYTPMIALFYKLGLRFKIMEAYVFNDHKRVLHSWSQTLIQEIQNRRAAPYDHPNDQAVNRAVIKMAKRTFRTTIGLIGSPKRKDKSEWSYRPDWRGMIVSDAAARIYYGMLRVKELCGKTPAAVYMDCLYYPSHNQSGFVSQAEPALPFAWDEQLARAYRYEGTYHLTKPGVRDLFRSDGRKLNFAEKIQQYEMGGE